MEPGVLYLVGDQYQALVGGGANNGFYMTATMPSGTQRPVFRSLIVLTGLVAAGSVLLALAIGFYVSHRTKREFDNLLTATARVASGDLSTPVMAYDEKEFAHLAESFSEMITKLRAAQASLAVSQKIAAWQVMGRKVAHEIKNPLTPITICADDLRRSYYEKLPEFEKTLDRNTTVIKSEVQRVIKLLDQFVAFARMAPPMRQDASIREILAEIEALYGAEQANGRLMVRDDVGGKTFQIDPAQIKQLLVNLIKNGLESAENAVVTVTAKDEDSQLVLTVTDSGPGFSAEKLARGFEPYLSSKKDGSGLGLVICQRIAIDHGGNIELFNRPEGGAGVRVRLPEA
jgi:nitrogen fixation/metabolism regulation signal transduction histidine kinase